MKRSPSYLDMQAEIESGFYDVPQKFSPEFAPGVAVLPTFASPVENFGVGRVLDVTADREWAVVKWDASGWESRVEPWDVCLLEVRS